MTRALGSVAFGSSSVLGRQTYPMPAPVWQSRLTSGPQAGIYESTTNDVMKSVWDFDGTAVEYISATAWLPAGYLGGTLTGRVYCERATGSASDVIWGLQARFINSGDLFDQAYGTAQTVTVTLTSALTLYESSEFAAITPAGTWAARAKVQLQLYRNATDAGDTLNGVDCRFHGLDLYYVLGRANDA